MIAHESFQGAISELGRAVLEQTDPFTEWDFANLFQACGLVGERHSLSGRQVLAAYLEETNKFFKSHEELPRYVLDHKRTVFLDVISSLIRVGREHAAPGKGALESGHVAKLQQKIVGRHWNGLTWESFAKDKKYFSLRCHVIAFNVPCEVELSGGVSDFGGFNVMLKGGDKPSSRFFRASLIELVGDAGSSQYRSNLEFDAALAATTLLICKTLTLSNRTAFLM